MSGETKMIYRNLGRTGIKVGWRGGGQGESGDKAQDAADDAGGRCPTHQPQPSLSSLRPQVSILSYGAWVTFGSQVGVESAKKLMQQARDAGVNL